MARQSEKANCHDCVADCAVRKLACQMTAMAGRKSINCKTFVRRSKT